MLRIINDIFQLILNLILVVDTELYNCTFIRDNIPLYISSANYVYTFLKYNRYIYV